MKKTSEKIVFFGSGIVAAKSLELLAKEFDIEAVITKPAKTHSRDPVPVIDLANKLGIKTFLPANRNELDILIKSKPIEANLAILIDYGIIVSQEVIDYFPLGIINSHFSLLPKLRGADPITFSILGDVNETGVSLMILSAGMDEGPILAQSKINILENETTLSLTNKLIELSNKMLIETLPKYLEKKIKPIPQARDIEPTYSRKLNKLDGKIDWSKSALEIEKEIRAFIEWPKSYTKLKDKDIIITKAHVINKNGEAGKFEIIDKNIVYYCGENALIIDKLKPSGKNEMDTKSFLAGYGSLID
jgi:methionyl-tRNA formyltransferase